MHVGSHLGIFKRLGKDPYADWFVILMSSFVLALVFIGFGVSLFLYINGGADAVSPAASAPTASRQLDKSDLAKVIADFQAKQQRAALFQTGYVGASDPSYVAGTSTVR